MEKNIRAIEDLLEKAAEYGVASYELVKLKAIDHVSQAVSSFMPNLFIVVLIGTILFFFNLGVALLIGEMVGKAFEGFFIVAAFYAVLAIIIRLFLYQRFKMFVCNYIIKQLFK
jgi:hypothetical protein